MMKQPLILLHGALGSKDQFSGLQSLLSEDFEVYTLNFEGHGGRSSERKFSMDHFTENVLQLMEEEQLGKSSFFGFSMGGYVALKLALHHPGKVEKIMTLGTKFHWTPETANQEVSRLNPLKIEEKVPQFARELEKRHAPLDWHQVMSKTGEMMMDLGKGGAIRTEEFAKVECPVLITRGSEDQMVSLEESQKIAEALPHGEFYSCEGFKHPLEQVDTKRLAQRIREFLDNI